MLEPWGILARVGFLGKGCVDLGLRRVFRQPILRQFDDFQLAEAAKPLRIFCGCVDIELLLHFADTDDAYFLHMALLRTV